MKRKVIQIADSTQLVSLPRKWCLRNAIKKGDELELVDQGNRILVESPSFAATEQKMKDISLDGLEPYLKYILHALYQKGYSEVVFKYEKQETAQKLQQILHEEMIGFEVVEQTMNSSTIRVVAGALRSEFDTILKRAFQLSVSMFDGLLEVLKTGNILPIKSLTYMQASSSKYTGFCKRMINNKVVYHEETSYIYLLVQYIETLALELKYFCFEIMRLPAEIQNLDPQLHELFKELGRLLKGTFDVYYNYDQLKTLQLIAKKQDIVVKAHEYLRKHEGQQTRFIHYIFNISEHIFRLLRAKMELES